MRIYPEGEVTNVRELLGFLARVNAATKLPSPIISATIENERLKLHERGESTLAQAKVSLQTALVGERALREQLIGEIAAALEPFGVKLDRRGDAAEAVLAKLLELDAQRAAA